MAAHSKQVAALTYGPYEDERQARADVADIHLQARPARRREVLGEANHARLADARERADVTLGGYGGRILSWLAGWEPQTCTVVLEVEEVLTAHSSNSME